MSSDHSTDVCIIDDEIDILNSFVESLRSEFNVSAHSSAESALTAMSNGLRPRVVLTDLCMPEVDGLRCIEKMRPFHLDSKVIMMSAHGDKKALIEAMNAGVSGYLEKPFTMRQLKNVLRSAMDAPAPLIGKSVDAETHVELTLELVDLLEELNEVYYNRLACAENYIMASQDSLYTDLSDKRALLVALNREHEINSRISAQRALLRRLSIGTSE